MFVCVFSLPNQSKGRYGGLFVSAAGTHRRQADATSGSSAPSPPPPADISTVAQDVAIAFGRPFRLLHSGCVTSPQVTASTCGNSI